MQTPTPHRLGLVGHAGRLGQQVLAALDAASAPKALQLSSLFVHQSWPAPHLRHLAQTDLAAFVAAADVVLDFSAPTACQSIAPVCAAQKRAYLVASSDLDAACEAALGAAAEQTAVLVATNLSAAVEVLRQLVQLAAQKLHAADIEIFEVHHRAKRDAPSGTALALGEAAACGRRATQGGPTAHVGARSAARPRRGADEIGYGVLRGGDVAGEHTVFFLADGERLELTHRATRPDLFARGALQAGLWLAQAKAGRYTMQDVGAPTDT